MLADLFISLAVAISTLSLLDFFLSDVQKARLADLTVRTWYVLDEARKWSFHDGFNNLALSGGLPSALGF